HWFAGYSWARAALLELERARPAAALPYCASLREHAALLGDCAEVPCGRVAEVTARLALGQRDDAALARALAELRTADAPVLLAQILVCVAEAERAAGMIAEAIGHADEAIGVAIRAERPTEIVLARSLLARIAEGNGRTGEVTRQRDALTAMSSDSLGARALAVLAEL
ncbi:MAG: hypothetical protein ABI678_18970, partial [Kofleriaceae bacterium]